MTSAADDLKALQDEHDARTDIDNLYAKKLGGADHESSAIGDDLVRRANKKLEAWFGGSKKYDKALLLFEQAAAAYKRNDNWEEAAQALVRSAEILEKQKETLESGNKYKEAALCMAHVSNEEAMKLLEMSISIHTMEGRLGAASRSWRELGELQEDEEDLQAAIESWRKCADCHESEGTLASALQCYLHIAELHIKEYQFKKASKSYEKCAELCMEKNINKGSLRDYFYNALLCQFVVSARKGSLKNLTSMFTRFVSLDRKFMGTWQERLIQGCMAAFEADDVQEFTQAIYEQDKRHKLDDLSTKILLEIKKIMKNPISRDDAEDMAAQLQ